MLTVAISLVLGVLAGVREASLRDRTITIISVLTTSIPEFASATFLAAVILMLAISLLVIWSLSVEQAQEGRATPELEPG